jgi:hypothetical protein
MDSDDWLLLQAGAVLGMMIFLALMKRRSRKEGLPRFVRKHSKRQRYIKSSLYAQEKTSAPDDKHSTDEEVD